MKYELVLKGTTLQIGAMAVLVLACFINSFPLGMLSSIIILKDCYIESSK